MNRRVQALTVAAATALVAPAFAQSRARDVEPYHVVVTADRLAARAGEAETLYRVLELQRDQVLRIDGELNHTLRASYPTAGTVFVRADEARLDGNTVVLTQASKLRAPHLLSGFALSWWPLLDNPMPAGTSLRHVETVKEGDGKVVAYRVTAPTQARLFIDGRSTRRATPEEVQRAGVSAEDDRPKPLVPYQPPQPKPEEPKPAATGTQPAPTPEITPTPPAADAPAPAVAEPAPVRKPDRVEQLEAAFQAVRRQPPQEAELEPLMAEFRKTIAELPAGTRRNQLQARLEAMRAQAEWRDNRRRFLEARAALDRDAGRVSEDIAAIERTRVYTIVGQLQPSTVYDGVNLPLMFRIQSVGGVVPRTLGYLRPDPKLELEKMLGQVIGVIGEASIDQTLQLNIVRPVKVDVLRAGGAPRSAGASEATPVDER